MKNPWFGPPVSLSNRRVPNPGLPIRWQGWAVAIAGGVIAVLIMKYLDGLLAPIGEVAVAVALGWIYEKTRARE